MSAASVKMNPFPGLRPFTQEEDYLFFGREEQTLELLQRLGGNRFVAVVGTSGSGKSSLVRCGLLSQLLGGKMLGAGAAWEIAVTHPGGNPLALLTDALLVADLYDSKAEHARENLLATLSRSHFGLVEAVKQADLGEGTNFLLVVDQFEEIFRFHEAGQTQQEAANEFVSLLLEAAAQTETPIYVVLTMRSDFIGECGQFEGLAEMVNRGEFLIPRLTREQYKRVIEGPIRVASGQIAPRLLQRLLNDLGQQADQLPCLQHALMRTWNVWAEKGANDALDLDDYQRVGKMSQALSLHADEIYESLASDRQRALCQGIFQALTVEESNSRGIRRPQRLGRLCQILAVSADELLPIIDAYRRSGVTFLMPAPEVELTDQTIIDISHESLMRVWTRLRQWVEEETQAAGIYHRLSESAALNQLGKAGLYRDPELGIALAWRESKRPNAAWAERYRKGFATATEFLETSQRASVAEEQAREAARQRELEQAQRLAEAQQSRLEQQQRSARKLRKLIGGLAVVALVAMLACVAALVSNKRANDLAIIAQQNSEIAEASAADADRERKTALKAQGETENALIQVAAQKAKVDSSLTIAEKAEKRSREFRYSTDMQLAAMLVGDVGANARQVMSRLADHEPAQNDAAGPNDDLRGFEWHYMRRLAEGGAAIFTGFDRPVTDSVVTPEGELITLDGAGILKHWDATTRLEKGAPLDLSKGRNIGARAISRDGRRAAVAIGDKVYVVDASTGAEIAPAISAQTRAGLIFSLDGRMVVTVGAGIGWWDAAAGEAIVQKDFKLSASGPVAVSADGLTVAVSGQGAFKNQFSVFKMDPQTKEVALLMDKIGTSATKWALAISPDGGTVAVSYLFSGQIDLYETASKKFLLSHGTAHSAAISAIGFNPGGTELVTAAMDGSIKVWADFKQLKSTKTTHLMGHAAEVNAIAFAPGGKRLVSASKDKTVRLWNLEQSAASPYRTVFGARGGRARFSPDGLLMAVSGESRLRDGATGDVVFEFPKRSDGFLSQSVAFSPDNRLMAAGFGGKKDVSFVELWDIGRGERLAVMPGTTAIPGFATTIYTGIVSGLTFAPDGKHLVAGLGSLYLLPKGNFGHMPLLVYDVTTRRLIRQLEGHRNFCISVTFSADGAKMASASYDGTARIWDTATWKELHVLNNPDAESDRGGRRVYDVAFSPDGKLLAMASGEGNVIIWDAATGEQLQALRGHASEVWSVVFSPDARTLASGSSDGTVRLWNTATWRELVRLDPGSIFASRSLAFSPDGRRLLAVRQPALLWSALSNEGESESLVKQLAALLESKSDFPHRIRMLSENLRLHEALDKLAQGKSNSLPAQAALAVTRANWHASRQEWKPAVEQFDRLKKLNAESPEDWLHTPGLLRLASALFHENRPVEAAALLTGYEKRREIDRLDASRELAGVFLANFKKESAAINKNPKARALLTNLDAGFIVVTDVYLKQLRPSFEKDLATSPNEPGAKAVLIAIDQTLVDVGRTPTNRLLDALRAGIDQKLAASANDPALLELSAQLAGQSSQFDRQVADYSTAIEALKQQSPEPAADVQRLYGRRGDAHVALRQWQEAIDDYARIVTDQSTDAQRLSKRALAYEALKNWDAAAADWSRAATGNPEGAKLLAEFARRLAAGGQVPLANGQFEKAQALYERALAADAENDGVATELAQLLLNKQDNKDSARWKVLTPVEMKTENGSKLELQKDGSVFVQQPAKNDTYSLVLQTELKGIKGLRLEVLADSRLPEGGPGWAEDGTFILSELSLHAAPAKSPDQPRPIALRNAWADYSQPGFDVRSALDGTKNSGWAIQPQINKDHEAVFETAEKVGDGQATRLTVRLAHLHPLEQRLVGRFRLSVCDAAAFEVDQRRFVELKVSDPWLKLGAAYAVNGRKDEAAQYFGRALQRADGYEARKPILELAARFDDLVSALVQGQPDDAQLQLALARNLAARGQQRLTEKQPAEALAELQKSREVFARLRAESKWTVLTPAELKSDEADALIRAALRNDLKESEVVDLSVALAKAHAQQGHIDEAVASLTEALRLATERAVKVRIITEAAPLAGVLEKLAERPEARVPVAKTVVPTSKEEGQTWRYTSARPAEGWQRADFDDKNWQEGVGSFGSRGAPVDRTEWKTDDIWLRREFTMPEGTWDDVLLLLHNDDDAEVYFNGVLALKSVYLKDYKELPLSAAARTALKPGKNVCAVHCRNNKGAQYIDVGVVAVKLDAGRLAFAQAAYDHKQFAVASRLWAEALASNPKLGDDRVTLHRDHAARAAALAAAGQGKDEPPPDDAAKANLRRQALDWLKAELTVWDKLLDSDPPQDRPAIVETLSRWQKDTALAGIRVAAARAKLPADEQTALTQFWADVATVLKKAQEKPK